MATERPIQDASYLESVAENYIDPNIYNTLTATAVYTQCEAAANAGELNITLLYDDQEIDYAHLSSIAAELETYNYITSITTIAAEPEDDPITEYYELFVNWDIT